MKVKDLDDQLELHRRRRDKDIPLKSHMKVRQEKLNQLVKAIYRYESQVAEATVVVTAAAQPVAVIEG